ncbi:phospholipid scramblase 1 [Ceratobasidium sp. 428]|nr:phospholipid scramblase 1 [Ceratobasidium sp. 428]
MPPKTLIGVWAGIDLALLLAGGICIAFSIIWRAPDLLRELVINTMDLNAGLGLGIMFAITFVVSIAAILTPKGTTGGLKALNWVLIADSVATIVIGSIVWFYTLQERKNFSEVWGQQSQDTLGRIQEQVRMITFFFYSFLRGLANRACGWTIVPMLRLLQWYRPGNRNRRMRLPNVCAQLDRMCGARHSVCRLHAE